MKGKYKALIGFVGIAGLYVAVGGPLVPGSVDKELQQCEGVSVQASAISNVYGKLFNVEADLFSDDKYITGLALNEDAGKFRLDLKKTYIKSTETGGVLENIARGALLKDVFQKDGCVEEIIAVVDDLK